MTPKAPELLLPAGSLDKMRAAYDFGADAVYAGQPRYSLRARNNEFRLEQIAQGIQEAHARGKKFFVTSQPHRAQRQGAHLPARHRARDRLQARRAHHGRPRPHHDGQGKVALRPEVHLSVQANTTNWATVKFWQKAGVSRIILSRELSLDEIEKIRQECPDMEIEVFVHGALCIAYSGRCLLSGYFNHRDPEPGHLHQRLPLGIQDARRGRGPEHRRGPGHRHGQGLQLRAGARGGRRPVRQHLRQRRAPSRRPDQVYLIEEIGRPGELMPIMEDEHGTYIMNSKDLRAVEHVERLVKIGVDSLKIEGRTKSLYYVARTAQVYRRAIDDAVAGRPFNPHLITELEGLANRGYTGGLLERRPANDYQNYETGNSVLQRAHFVGEVRGWADGLAEVETKNRFQVGDMLEIIHPQGNRQVRLEKMFNLDGEPVQVAQGSPVRVCIPLDGPVEGALIARLLQI
ncbi:peptidase U32 [Alicycliphilus sp. B1]|nr:peptidase U32 [Alicycliphilus sp. B1]